ncbi:hypothetical protein [Paenilisteria newyorkensis]|uniref:hypothetical protein n=1 Tax=Listeria newyorkensis TaxID=1497681 RepID=UPI000669FB5B|nr:hypothetical protein [Listeria newyorkensis]KMT63242.1 hypothetical protein X559_0378 [Listeria newyorkensis]
MFLKLNIVRKIQIKKGFISNVKGIQLPSGRLAEHAKEIGSSANDISFNKDVQNLKNVEQAFVASKKAMADMWSKALI